MSEELNAIITELKSIDEELGNKFEYVYNNTKNSVMPENYLDGCIPPLTNESGFLSEEEIIAFQEEVMAIYEDMFSTLINKCLDNYYVSSKELEKETKSYIISINSYLIMKFMEPQPKFFEELAANPYYEDISLVYKSLNGFKETFLTYENEFYDFYQCNPVIGSLIPNTTEYDDLYLSLLYTIGTSLDFKINTIASLADDINQMTVNCGFQFMFERIEDSINISITVEERANYVYKKFKLKSWIEIHNMNIPKYEYPDNNYFSD